MRTREKSEGRSLPGIHALIWSLALALLAPACAQFDATGGFYPIAAPALKNPSWWNSAYNFRQRITFGTDHTELPTGFTATLVFNSTAAAGVQQTTGNDVRVVRQVGETHTELDRIGTGWNGSSTSVEFRLQDTVAANANEATSAIYYVYYGNAGAGTPPTNENAVYYTADFFDRADGAANSTSDVANDWTEWNNGTSDFRIQSGILYGYGSDGFLEAGVSRTFALGAIPGRARVTFDWRMVGIVQGTWALLVNLGGPTMSSASMTTGVGPALYFGEGGSLVPGGGLYHMDHNLGGVGELENTVLPNDTAPYQTMTIRLDVNSTAQTFDYYRNGSLVTAGASFVNATSNLTALRIAVDNYQATLNPMGYDNLKVQLLVDNDPEVSADRVEWLYGLF